MANGKRHRLATVVLTPAVAYGAYHLTGAPILAASAAGGCLLGLWCHPDRDIDANADRLIWWPYAQLVKHRSPISHMPIIGTLGRLVYLWAFAQLAAVVLALIVGEPVALLIPPAGWAPYLLAGVAGLAASDAGHWLLDGCPF